MSSVLFVHVLSGPQPSFVSVPSGVSGKSCHYTALVPTVPVFRNPPNDFVKEIRAVSIEPPNFLQAWISRMSAERRKHKDEFGKIPYVAFLACFL